VLSNNAFVLDSFGDLEKGMANATFKLGIHCSAAVLYKLELLLGEHSSWLP
jgi:hypothetical protein